MNITRLWTCSPVATRIGAIARAIAAWPSTSSGLVGSSIHHGSNRPSTRIASIASPTSQTWFASIISFESSPISSRSSARAADVVRRVGADLDLEVRPARGPGLADEPAHLLVGVAEPAGRRVYAGIAVARAARPRARPASAPARASSSSASPGRERVGEVAEVDARRRAPPGVMSASSFQSGLPSDFAYRSQTALTTAAVARWITPFSGPIQRSWLVAREPRARRRPCRRTRRRSRARPRAARAPRSRRRRPRCRARS